MKVLVVYASRHGATEEIAQRIATGLTDAGLDAAALAAAEARSVDDYDAFVVGSAVYMFHWMKEAVRFVKRHRETLAARPVWLFSSGPLGTDLVDDEGKDVLEEAEPKDLDELEAMAHPREHRVFFGAWDPEAPAKGMAERFLKAMPASRESLPAGDFRDWPAIDAWAAAIASELQTDVDAT